MQKPTPAAPQFLHVTCRHRFAGEPPEPKAEVLTIPLEHERARTYLESLIGRGYHPVIGPFIPRGLEREIISVADAPPAGLTS